MSGTTYLITGANRGIGLGLVTALVKRPNTTVVATVRKLSSNTSLSQLPTASGSKVIVVKIDSQDYSDPASAVAELQSKHGITKVDVVIANAGISDHYAPASKVSFAEAERHYAINVVAPIALFQATLPLLEKGSSPQFVGISSGAGSIGDMEKIPIQVTAYGGTKAALNFFLRKAHFENPNISIYAVNPG